MEACETTLNKETEEIEQLGPKQKSCCSCNSQKIGITVLALIKLMLSLALLIMLLETLSLGNIFGYFILFYNIVPWIAFFLDAVDILIAIFVIIGVCLYNRRIMKMYYMYSICVFGSLAFMCFVIVFTITMNIIPMLIFVFGCFLVFMMQVYLNNMLKSEVLKIESIEQFQFQSIMTQSQ